jgi:hypothetical protein
MNKLKRKKSGLNPYLLEESHIKHKIYMHKISKWSKGKNKKENLHILEKSKRGCIALLTSDSVSMEISKLLQVKRSPL